jgi:hypothetical protein
MRVRPLLFVAAGFICASTTVAIAQEASIYGVFCDTPEQVEMYILERERQLTRRHIGQSYQAGQQI